MNEKTWKYHPRRSPKKSSRKTAVRLAIAALDDYMAGVEDCVSGDAQIECLFARPGRISFKGSGAVPTATNQQETMRKRLFSARSLSYWSPKGTA